MDGWIMDEYLVPIGMVSIAKFWCPPPEKTLPQLFTGPNGINQHTSFENHDTFCLGNGHVTHLKSSLAYSDIINWLLIYHMFMFLSYCWLNTTLQPEVKLYPSQRIFSKFWSQNSSHMICTSLVPSCDDSAMLIYLQALS